MEKAKTIEARLYNRCGRYLGASIVTLTGTEEELASILTPEGVLCDEIFTLLALKAGIRANGDVLCTFTITDSEPLYYSYKKT